MPATQFKILPGLVFLFIFCCGLRAGAQNENPAYDKALADSLGSDDYGMKRYVFVILKTGPVKIDNKAVSDSLFRGHMQNLDRMAKNGKLMVAGPIQKNEKAYRGILILNVKSFEEAKVLLDMDPAIKSGIFETEMFTWYGSAALPMYLPYHDRLEKKISAN